MTQRVAVIGAGLAGLSCARVLRRAGCYVEVFEQDRLIGGRVGTLRSGLVTFDHGAQYIAARTDRFRQFIDELVRTGYAQRWVPRAVAGEEGASPMHPWFVGTPGMSAIVRPLAESVRINTNRRVHTLQRTDRSWHLWFEDQTVAGPYAAVAVCVPAREARLLLGAMESLAEQIDRARMSPCWALLLQLDERVLPEFDVYSDMSQIIRWVGRNNAKPGRISRGDQIVIHASPAWSRQTEDAEPELVAEELWGEVSTLLGLPQVQPTQMTAHLWRHGLVETSLGESYIFAREHMVGVAGDWCLGRLAEHAFESGALLGKTMVDSMR